MQTFLDFEKPIAELEGKVQELKHLDDDAGVNIEEEVAKLQGKADLLLRQAYAKLTPWQKVQVARHPDRPHFSHFVAALVEDFTPLAGDRTYADDQAVIGGLGRFRGRSVMVIGQEKGSGTAGRLKHNFGMARPEGYRKAIRLMRLADRFRMPVISIIDTPAAYPGIGAEERGQAEIIARSIETCLEIGVPVIVAVVGEGGSGGAVALAAGNRIVMLEHAIYSVIPPEGCASILWRTADKAQEAAAALKLTAQDLLKLNIIDEVIPEPIGGAHRHPDETIAALGAAIASSLNEFDGQESGVLRESRRRKFLEMGQALG